MVGARDNLFVKTIIEYANNNSITTYVQDENDELFPQIIHFKFKDCIHKNLKEVIKVKNYAYLGPRYDSKIIKDIFDSNTTIKDYKIEFCSDQEISKRISEKLSESKVIGWFQDETEWGPRALGNRSIICDPRRSDIKDILNLKIKKRESFRPFAPSILREKVPEWFEQDDDVPFMMKVFQIREERRAEIPAVTHVDGSGRLQTVFKETNSRYYKLIEKFSDLTGVPIVLNTSFNENEPVVCKPEEALACFLRTKMDVLVMGNWMIRRNPADSH